MIEKKKKKNVLLRGTIFIRTYGTHKKPTRYIFSHFYLTILGPIYYRSPVICHARVSKNEVLTNSKQQKSTPLCQQITTTGKLERLREGFPLFFLLFPDLFLSSRRLHLARSFYERERRPFIGQQRTINTTGDHRK